MAGCGEFTMKLIKLKAPGSLTCANFFHDFGRKVFTWPYIFVWFPKVRYFKIALSILDLMSYSTGMAAGIFRVQLRES